MAASSSIKGLTPPAAPIDGSSMRVAIVRTRWNAVVIDALVAGARAELVRCGVAPENVVEIAVPGAYELPLGARAILPSHDPETHLNRGSASEYGGFDAVICIGCLIKGETMHFEYICEAVTNGIMRVQLDTRVPVIFGVLCVLTEEQALVRAGLQPGMHNHGVDWAQAALEMSQLCRRANTQIPGSKALVTMGSNKFTPGSLFLEARF